MPKRKKCWASWVYTEQAGKQGDKIDLTYWMNSLQTIPHDDLLLVTLNSQTPIREELIYDEVDFAHPVYDLAMMAAVERIKASNGARNTWFCGAWMRNGFHEDGYASAYDVVEALEARPLRVAAE
jgi:predicted NAD/FAD-binding protein